MHDLPLVFFTVLSQLAVGGMIMLWIIDVYKVKLNMKTGKLISGALVMITGLSILISLLHLGHPFQAYLALTHLSVSWLSREVILFSLFFLAQVFYFFQWKEGKDSQRLITGGIAAILGILAVISSALIYVLPSVPAWNNVSPVIFFLLTAVLLGPLFVGTMIAFLEKNVINLSFPMIMITGIYGTASLVYLSVLFSGGMTLELTAQNLTNNALFYVRGILSWILPFVVFTSLILSKNKKQLSPVLLASLVVFVLVGEFIGRELFYSTAVGLEIGQFFK